MVENDLNLNEKEYWRLLAEEREKALNTTLEENGDLSEILEQRSEEVEQFGDIQFVGFASLVSIFQSV